MNTVHLKRYAAQARKDFIAAVTARANLLGLCERDDQLVLTEAKVSGDLVMIAGRPWPVKVNEQRNKLIARMRQQGFGHTVEAVAYAWFNRLAALRYMELHDYLGHGRRVLSNPQGGLPEVLAHALDLAESNALPGLNTDTVRQLKLANQDPELYRLVLIAQCNALHQAMPFLFEQLGDETELLLPENLLLTDSVVAKLVSSVPEGDWQQIEIIGWLYQFYISEKKDQVIGKAVKSEDVPAATQLFTPNWIVKYMVQNSLGAQWLATYPESTLRTQMAYFIEPAEQADEVKRQLAAITPSALNPEELTLIDPACGSGHILVEAYDLFKGIYLERGYRQRDVAKLILEKNLFGLDIDERAAQLTGFALMMKGRADDRQLFEKNVRLNVLALVSSSGFDAALLSQSVKLVDYGLEPGDLAELKALFESATTFGSLIEVPVELKEKIPALKRLADLALQDLLISESVTRMTHMVRQAELLAARYDSVVANPPFMGIRYQPAALKRLISQKYPGIGGDLFSCFIRRLRHFTSVVPAGRAAFVAPYTWMFLSDYDGLREEVLRTSTTISVVKLEYNAFEPAAVPVATLATLPISVPLFKGSFIELGEFKGADTQPTRTLEAIQRRDACSWYYTVQQSAFEKIPGKPFAFWLAPDLAAAFEASERLGNLVDITGSQTVTANNSRFLRLWFEVSCATVGSETGRKWKAYAKGGSFRRWYGNLDWIVDWSEAAREFYRSNPSSSMLAEKYWYREGITYTDITTLGFTSRYLPAGCIYDKAGPSLHSENVISVLAFMNSSPVAAMLGALNPTMHCQVKDVSALPGDPTKNLPTSVVQTAERLIEIYRDEWDMHETSVDFRRVISLEGHGRNTGSEFLSDLVDAQFEYVSALGNEARNLQVENDQFFLDRLSIEGYSRPSKDGPLVTFRFPWLDRSESQNYSAIRRNFHQQMARDIGSYVIGCMMGRYSLDAPGLVYAQSGNVGFDASRYNRFPADEDGIVPITDDLWFEDDAALRIREFLLTAWGADSLEQNLSWLAETLGRKASESPEEAIRRYLSNKFFKDHLQTYKKRPIYWLFSSGKQGAFQALVYLHRYNAGTLSRLRAEYVIPLTGKMQSRIEQLERDAAIASSTAARNRFNKQLESLRKKHLELLAYDEQLRHFADQRIELDLDDGVKANYGKFGDLLADVKAVVGKQDEE